MISRNHFDETSRYRFLKSNGRIPFILSYLRSHPDKGWLRSAGACQENEEGAADN
jgi:hypothetical protein